MSKSITIPDIGQNPIRLRINSTDYVFHAGETATVPDEVASLLAGIVESFPKPAEDGYRTKPATIGDVEDMIEKGGGGGSSALICEGSVSTDPETGEKVYTLETPLSEIVEAYQAGREILLPMPLGVSGAVFYLHPQAAAEINGVKFATFQGYFDNEGTLEHTTVAFRVVQTATVTTRKFYAGPYDIPCEVDMTQQPPTISTDVSHDDVLAAYLAGRVLRLVANVDIGIEGVQQTEFLPLTRCMKEGPEAKEYFLFSGAAGVGGGSIVFLEAKLKTDGPSLSVTPLTT